MSDLDIPSGPETLTAPWLTAALRGGGLLEAATAVDSLAVEVIGADRGIGGQVARLTPRYAPSSAALPATLIAKFPSAVEVTRGGGRFLRLPEREVRLYRELAPLIPMRMPACHHAAVDAQGDAFVLLLEDLGASPAGDDLAGANDEQLAAAVEALAGLHAAFWRSPLLEAIEWMPAIDDRGVTWQRLFAVAWRDARDAAATSEAARALLELVGEGQELAERLTLRGRSVYERLAASPPTLLHGDFRLDNLFFAPIDGGDRLAAVDWSNAARGPGPCDLAYLLGVALAPEERRAREEDLLRRYHESLLAAGVEGYDLDRCREDYRRSYLEPLMRMFFLVARGHAEGGGGRARAVLSRMVSHAAAAALDLDADALLEE